MTFIHIRAFYTNYCHHISNNFKNIISVSFNLYKYDITNNIRHAGTQGTQADTQTSTYTLLLFLGLSFYHFVQ